MPVVQRSKYCRRLKVAVAWTLDLVLPPELVQLRLGGSRGASREHYEPGQDVFQQGEVGDRLYLILKGEVHEIKAIMGKSNELGMKTFDQALFDLYEADKITFEDALRNADSMNELRLRIKLEGKAAKDSDKLAGLDHLSIKKDEKEESGVMFRR